MNMIYYPSCRFTAQFPEESKAIKTYLTEHYGCKIAGCCKPSLKTITNEDTIVYICNTCAGFFRESTPAQKVISVWELLCNDKDFIFPNYTGRRMTIQDCWRARGNTPQQDAVRQILKAMNIETVELENNREKSDFCGVTLYDPLPPNYDKLAPNQLVKNAKGLFIPHTQEEKSKLMEEHCKDIETEEVLCYCVPCTNGIITGGKKGIHLAELVFGNI